MKGVFYNGLEAHQADEPNCTIIMNNDYSKHGIQQLRDFLEIKGEFEYDAQAIQDVQTKRYAEMDIEQFMCKERTFIMIKPDGVQRGLVGKII